VRERYEKYVPEFPSAQAFERYLATTQVHDQSLTTFDLMRRLHGNPTELCFQTQAPWVADSDALALEAALIFVRHRVVVVADFYRDAEIDLVKRIMDNVKRSTKGESISGQKCKQWKLSDQGAFREGLVRLRDATLREEYLQLFGVTVPRRLQRFFYYAYGTDQLALEETLRLAESSLLSYVEEGDQRMHLDHLRARTFNTMTTANGLDFISTGVADIARVAAAILLYLKRGDQRTPTTTCRAPSTPWRVQMAAPFIPRPWSTFGAQWQRRRRRISAKPLSTTSSAACRRVRSKRTTCNA
jgi:hypothetical protein